MVVPHGIAAATPVGPFRPICKRSLAIGSMGSGPDVRVFEGVAGWPPLVACATIASRAAVYISIVDPDSYTS